MRRRWECGLGGWWWWVLLEMEMECVLLQLEAPMERAPDGLGEW